jgi:hypothetical protein
MWHQNDLENLKRRMMQGEQRTMLVEQGKKNLINMLVVLLGNKKNLTNVLVILFNNNLSSINM